MNIGGGEAADQLVRMMLSGTEMSVRLGGSALKNLLALTMALAKNNKTLSGKVNLGKMLRETRDLRQFPMTPEQYKEFSKLAKKQKILFSAIRDKDDQGKLIDVILPVTELDRANMILERVGYLSPESDMSQERRQPPEKGPKRFLKHWIEKAKDKVKSMKRSEDERPPSSPEWPEADSRQEAAPPKDEPFPGPPEWPGRQEDESRREVAPPKKDSRSEQGSPVIKPSSSTRKEAEATRTTSERPSVLDRLKAYREQIDQKRRSVPTKEKTRAKPKQR